MSQHLCRQFYWFPVLNWDNHHLTVTVLLPTVWLSVCLWLRLSLCLSHNTPTNKWFLESTKSFHNLTFRIWMDLRKNHIMNSFMNCLLWTETVTMCASHTTSIDSFTDTLTHTFCRQLASQWPSVFHHVIKSHTSKDSSTGPVVLAVSLELRQSSCASVLSVPR